MDNEEEGRPGPDTEDEEIGDTETADTQPQASGQKNQPKKKGTTQQVVKKAAVKATEKAAEALATAVTSETGGWGGTAVKIAEYGAKLANTLRKLEKAGEVIREGVQEAKKFGKYLGYICSFVVALLLFFIMLFAQTTNTAVQQTSSTAEITTQIIKTGPEAVGNDATEINYSIQVSDQPGVSDISVIDTIPSNATFVRANGVPHVNTATNTVTWSTKESFPASPSNATFTITLKPTAPNSYVINKASANSTGAIIGGLTLPSNFDQNTCFDAPPQNSGGLAGKFCQMPPAPDGSYELIGTRWGSLEMIGVIYTVAKRWKSVYPEGNLIIGDITAAGGHISHFYGVAADITATTNKHDCVADMVPGGDGRCRYGTFNPEATTELAKMFIDTGYADLFLFKSDVEYTRYPNPDIPKGFKTTFTKEIFNYGRSKFPNRITYSNRIIQNRNDHNNHFHLYIDRDTKNYPNAGTFSNTFNNSQLIRCGQTTGHKLC